MLLRHSNLNVVCLKIYNYSWMIIDILDFCIQEQEHLEVQSSVETASHAGHCPLNLVNVR